MLEEENAQIQAVMDKELQNRKLMIEELIYEKKVLYQQLNHH